MASNTGGGDNHVGDEQLARISMEEDTDMAESLETGFVNAPLHHPRPRASDSSLAQSIEQNFLDRGVSTINQTTATSVGNEQRNSLLHTHSSLSSLEQPVSSSSIHQTPESAAFHQDFGLPVGASTSGVDRSSASNIYPDLRSARQSHPPPFTSSSVHQTSESAAFDQDFEFHSQPSTSGVDRSSESGIHPELRSSVSVSHNQDFGFLVGGPTSVDKFSDSTVHPDLRSSDSGAYRQDFGSLGQSSSSRADRSFESNVDPDLRSSERTQPTHPPSTRQAVPPYDQTFRPIVASPIVSGSRQQLGPFEQNYPAIGQGSGIETHLDFAQITKAYSAIPYNPFDSNNRQELDSSERTPSVPLFKEGELDELLKHKVLEQTSYTTNEVQGFKTYEPAAKPANMLQRICKRCRIGKRGGCDRARPRCNVCVAKNRVCEYDEDEDLPGSSPPKGAGGSAATAMASSPLAAESGTTDYGEGPSKTPSRRSTRASHGRNTPDIAEPSSDDLMAGSTFNPDVPPFNPPYHHSTRPSRGRNTQDVAEPRSDDKMAGNTFNPDVLPFNPPSRRTAQPSRRHNNQYDPGSDNMVAGVMWGSDDEPSNLPSRQTAPPSRRRSTQDSTEPASTDMVAGIIPQRGVNYNSLWTDVSGPSNVFQPNFEELVRASATAAPGTIPAEHVQPNTGGTINKGKGRAVDEDPDKVILEGRLTNPTATIAEEEVSSEAGPASRDPWAGWGETEFDDEVSDFGPVEGPSATPWNSQGAGVFGGEPPLFWDQVKHVGQTQQQAASAPAAAPASQSIDWEEWLNFDECSDEPTAGLEEPAASSSAAAPIVFGPPRPPVRGQRQETIEDIRRNMAFLSSEPPMATFGGLHNEEFENSDFKKLAGCLAKGSTMANAMVAQAKREKRAAGNRPLSKEKEAFLKKFK